MDAHNSLVILSLAFGLGIMHAMDADHIMAVSGLSNTRLNNAGAGYRQSISFCLRWALGHGLTLLLIGAMVFLFGMAIPSQLSFVAEIMVAIVLIGIGCFIFWELFKRNAHIHFHQHDGFAQHAHWHTHKTRTSHKNDKHLHGHGAVMVGVLHGGAGSAALLALIPIAQMQSPWQGLGYVSLFSLGVIVAMLIFGGVLGQSLKWLKQRGSHVFRNVRLLIASSAVGVGLFLLSEQLLLI